MKKITLLALAMVSVVASSCNTFIGVGRDMRLAGEGMEKAASKASGSSDAGSDAGGAPIY